MTSPTILNPKWPRTEGGWHRLVQGLWGIQIAREPCCSEHTAPWTAFYRGFMAAEPDSTWHASRGFGGKSVLLAHLSMTEALVLGCGVTVLGGSGEQSQRVLDAMRRGWQRPGISEYLASDPTKQRVRLKHGGGVTALTASTRSARGLHDPRLRFDELDEMKTIVYEAALGQPMEQQGRYGRVQTNLVRSSTYHYPNGLMARVLRESREQGKPVYQWCWKCNLISNGGWLRPEAVEWKRQIIPEHVWRTEFDLQEPSSDDRVWDAEIIRRTFRPRHGRFAGGLGERCIVEKAQTGARYSTGVDWARKKDWTIIVTFRTDVTPWLCVAWERLGRMPWPQIIERYEQRVREYPGTAVHDETGIGDVVGDMARVRNAEGFTFSGSKRDALLTNYVSAIEDGAIEYPMIKWAYDEHLYTRFGDLYQAGSELRQRDSSESADRLHLPDSVAAGALAWHGRRRRRPGISFVASPV